jgi:hypothetical protein
MSGENTKIVREQGGAILRVKSGGEIIVDKGGSIVSNAEVSVDIAALTVGDGYSGIRSVVAAAAPSNTYGVAGYFESDLSGTIAGTVYGFGSWINLAAAAVAGAHMLCAQDNGIYAPAGLTVSSAKMIIGMRMELVIDDGADPGSLFLFSTNIYSNKLTALFDVNAAVDLNFATGAASTNVGKIPLFKDGSANKTWYVNVYDG